MTTSDARAAFRVLLRPLRILGRPARARHRVGWHLPRARLASPPPVVNAGPAITAPQHLDWNIVQGNRERPSKPSGGTTTRLAVVSASRAWAPPKMRPPEARRRARKARESDGPSLDYLIDVWRSGHTTVTGGGFTPRVNHRSWPAINNRAQDGRDIRTFNVWFPQVSAHQSKDRKWPV